MFVSKGVTLVEVLISLFLLSVILLGFDAMEITALHQAHKNFYLNIATNQIQSMAERLMVIKDHPGLSESVAMWNQENSEVLSGGHGEVSGAYPHFIVRLNWEESHLAETVNL